MSTCEQWHRSILAATPLMDLHEAYPDLPVYRFIPSLPVEVRQGAVVQAAPLKQAELDAQVSELFSELGTLVTLPDALVDVAMGLMSCAPAYVALVAEAGTVVLAPPGDAVTV